MVRALVVTADDYGYCRRRDDAVLEAYAAGVVTRASLLVAGESATQAASRASRLGMPLGLHFNITEGFPTRGGESSLVDARTGTFHDKHRLLADGLADGVSRDDVRLELVAQVERFRSLTGRYPHYVDGHQHAHVYPGVGETIALLAPEYPVREVRIPNERRLDDCPWIAPLERREFYARVCRLSEAAVRYYEPRFRSTDRFVGLSTMGADITPSRLRSALTAIVLVPTG